jgi:hypothetical protein
MVDTATLHPGRILEAKPGPRRHLILELEDIAFSSLYTSRMLVW